MIATIVRSALAFTALTVTSASIASADRDQPKPADADPNAIGVLVMDPLAAPLSCPCVEGYAQREYEGLARHLEKKLGLPVELAFNESMKTAWAKSKRLHLVIGKDSVVRADAAALEVPVHAVAGLTDKQGELTQTGLIVVSKNDTAKTVADLAGYHMIFGPAECEEKHQAAIAILKKAKVQLPDRLAIDQACSDGACKVIERGQGSAAVISSYAAPLLEGCGTIKKGDLRVVAKTAPVPFVTAFVTEQADAGLRAELKASLADVGTNLELCEALESLIGFVPVEEDDANKSTGVQTTSMVKKKVAPPLSPTWTQWRGPRRDGWCPSLPPRLPDRLPAVWDYVTTGSGLGGIAATTDYVVFGQRDLTDAKDVFVCLLAGVGLPLWTVEYEAPGNLDYGNSPRATPLFADGYVYLFGAHGHLHCVQVETGDAIWKRNLAEDYPVARALPWGYCGSPLLVDGKLIIAPGSKEASLVALSAKTGVEIWRAPGVGPSYGSLIAASLGGVRQIVGHDATSLGGWDVKTGRRLWRVVPEIPGDFNVPTPLVHGGHLLVYTKNNGLRAFAFKAGGVIQPEPVAINRKLNPDMSSAVIVGNQLYCINNLLYCVDLDANLELKWRQRDRSLGDYGSLITDGKRVLAVGKGALLLFAAGNDEYAPVSKTAVFGDGLKIYSHPALVGHRLFLRGEKKLVCLNLNGQQ